MGKIRKPGKALFHTYIHPKITGAGRTFQARVVDVRTGSDIKCSSDTFDSAVSCAKQQVLEAATTQEPKPHRMKKTKSR
jgi:hypothetical protein